MEGNLYRHRSRAVKIVWLIVFTIFLHVSAIFGASITPEVAKDAALAHLDALEKPEFFQRYESLRSYQAREGSSPHSISDIQPLFNDEGYILTYVMVLEPQGYNRHPPSHCLFIGRRLSL